MNQRIFPTVKRVWNIGTHQLNFLLLLEPANHGLQVILLKSSIVVFLNYKEKQLTRIAWIKTNEMECTEFTLFLKFINLKLDSLGDLHLNYDIMYYEII